MRRSVLVAAVLLLSLVLAGCGTATLLPDGRVLLNNLVTKQYDPATGTVTNLPSAPTPRVYATSTLLRDGRVLIAGGAGGMAAGLSGTGTEDASALASADLYDPATGTYTPTGSMAKPRAFHTATLLADGRVLIQGGGAPAADQASSGAAPEPNVVPPPEIYDPATGQFSPAGGDTLIPLVLATSTLLQDGRVLFAGGQTVAPTPAGATPDPNQSSGVPTGEAELFDPASGTFSATGSMADPRLWHTATALPDGRVLIVGGTTNTDLMTSGQTADPTTRSAEVYDPATGTFAPTGAPIAPRMGHAAVALQDGRVLISGGLDTDQATPQSFATSAEIYDPATGTFTATGDMVAGQAFHTATLLPDGRVLIAGFGEEMMAGMSSGTTPDLLGSAQIYDPATGTWTALEVEPAILPSTAPSEVPTGG
jgi:hypothetical protein